MSKKGKKAKKDEVDDSTQQIMRFYNKKINSLGIASNKIFVQAVAQAIENQDNLKKLHILEEVGPNAIRGICEALTDLGYVHVSDIWFVKTGLGDEGCKYLAGLLEKIGPLIEQKITNKKTKKAFILNLTENEIGSLGCKMIGEALSPMYRVPLQELVMDFNPFSCDGLQMLANGLNLNPFVQKLSLNYCALDLESVKYLQQILCFIDSDLRVLELEGNYLRNEGIYQLFRALEANSWLEELNVANNQFGECENIPVVEKICEVLTKSNSLQVYDLRGNSLYDDSIKKFLECIKMYKVVCRFEIPILIQKELLEELKKTLKRRKRKKKKRKAKKAKGRSKKK